MNSGSLSKHAKQPLVPEGIVNPIMQRQYASDGGVPGGIPGDAPGGFFCASRTDRKGGPSVELRIRSFAFIVHSISDLVCSRMLALIPTRSAERVFEAPPFDFRLRRGIKGSTLSSPHFLVVVLLANPLLLESPPASEAPLPHISSNFYHG